MIFLFFFILINQISAEEFKLSILAVFRDEAPYLKEWIEFHRVVGVEHFYLVNHLSRDHYQAVLQPYINDGTVELDNWNEEYASHGWAQLQKDIYQKKIEEIRDKTHWLAVIDIDEFLFPVVENNLIDVLNSYEEFAGLCVNWQLYGTSNIEKLSDKDLQIEKFTLKAQVDYVDNHMVKSIVKPKYVNFNLRFSPHYFRFQRKHYTVDENFERFIPDRTKKVNINKIRINHYWTRDKYYFYNSKIPSYVKRRDNNMKNFALKREANLNEIEDTDIWRFLPSLKARMMR